MKKLIITIALAFLSVFAFAQTSKVLRPRIEIAQVETEDIKTVAMEVFYMNDESPRMYYLSLGNLSIGGHIVSIEMDPLFELFIPLGNTLDEAIAKMEEIKAMYKMPVKKVKKGSGKKVAVLYADGEITRDGNEIAGEKFAAQIEKLRKDESVKAVVFRVNSPMRPRFSASVSTCVSRGMMSVRLSIFPAHRPRSTGERSLTIQRINIHSLLQEDVVSLGTMTDSPRAEKYPQNASRAFRVSPDRLDAAR